MEKIIDIVLRVLGAEGYEVKQSDEHTLIALIAGLPAVFTIVGGHMKITTQVAVLGDIREEDVALALLRLLSANTVVNPYAFAMIDAEDDPTLKPEEFQIILTDKLPVADMQQSEVVESVNALWAAIAESRNILREFTAGNAVPAL